MSSQKNDITKISRPRISKVIDRERVFRLLDTGREKTAIWISAPAGSGKTTLVNSYLSSRKLPCFWYDCDQRDDDPVSFFYYMGLAGKKAAPKRKKPLPLLTPEYMAGIPTFARRYFEDLYSRLKSPSCIIFDDYQDISNESMLHNIINIALSCVPEGISVIIISRTLPHKAFVRLRANDGLHYIEWKDISFTKEETKNLISLKNRTKALSSDMEELIISKTNGWAAGIVLSLEQPALTDRAKKQQQSIEFDDIFDYFSDEIFSSLTPKEQKTLLIAAYIPDIIPSVVNTLAKAHNAEDIFSSLTKQNFFVTKHTHTKQMYKLHPLFKDFLLLKGSKVFSESEIENIKKTAASLLLKKDYVEEAAQLYLSAEDWEGLISVILQHASVFLAQGRNTLLEKWITSIPDEIINNAPWLLLWLGQSRLFMQPSQSLKDLEHAFDLFTGQKDIAGSFISLSGIVNAIILKFHNLSQLKPWKDRLETLIKESGGIPDGEIGDMITACMLSILGFTEPWHPDFLIWAERGKKLIKTSKNANTCIQVLSWLCNHCSFHGNFPEAKLIIEQGKRILKSAGNPAFLNLQLKMVEAPYYMSKGDYKTYIELAREGLDISKKTGIHILDFMFLSQSAWGYLDTGNIHEAKKYLERMKKDLEIRPPIDTSFYHFHESKRYRLEGDLATADIHADLSLKLSEGTQYYMPVFLCSLNKALISFQLKKPREAEKYLKQAADIALKGKGPYPLFSLYLIKAYGIFLQEKNKEGIKELAAAMSIGAKHKLVQSFVWDNDMMVLLCINAMENGIEEEYVRSLITKRKIVPETPPVHLENWPWQFKVYTMGRFSLLKDGTRVKFSGKTQKKPLDMLKAIIALGGKDVPLDELSDTLWPDADGDMAHKSIKVTLHRLRKLTNNDAITLTEGCLSLNPSFFWVDAWAFERTCEQMKELIKKSSKGNGKDITSLAEKVLQLYAGPFLDKDPGNNFSISNRERLRSKFLETISLAGEQLCTINQYDMAISCYEKGVETDTFMEEFYRGLMGCYISKGEHSKAINTYNNCKKIFSDFLGVEPSTETDKLFRMIQ